MTEDDEFVSRLIHFGLSEKEAQLYLYLLKYGPKTPSPIAKALKTYREDVHRTLTSLIEKGMVRQSFDTPTIYTAADLDTALKSVLMKQESQLREMEEKKRELHELSKRQRFQLPTDVSTFKIIKTLRDFVSVAIPILTSLKEEWLSVVPPQAAVVLAQFGMLPFTKEFIERGGKLRSIIDITYPIIEIERDVIDMGGEVRHLSEVGVAYVIFDRKISISAINAELNRFSLDSPLTALYTDDPTYAQYLTSTFELLWKQAIPAEDRIQELLAQGPPQIDV
jgi:predicted transcriptional regulator